MSEDKDDINLLSLKGWQAGYYRMPNIRQATFDVEGVCFINSFNGKLIPTVIVNNENVKTESMETAVIISKAILASKE